MIHTIFMSFIRKYFNFIIFSLFIFSCEVDQQDLLSGDLNPDQSAITISRIDATTSSTVEVRFLQGIDPASVTGSQNFFIESETGSTLYIYGAVQSGTNNQLFYVSTDAQIPGTEYTLTVFNLSGVDGTEAPESGVQSTFLGYDPAVTPPPATMDTFQITTTGNVFVGQPFTLNIQAIGTNGQPFNGYTGTVNLTDAGGTGQIDMTTASIISGAGSVAVTYNALTPNLFITATDPSNSSWTGTSGAITVAATTGGSVNMSFSAAAISTTQIRLNWEIIANSVTYNIYRKTGSSSYTLVKSIDPVFKLWLDNNGGSGLATSTTYDYRIDAVDMGNNIIDSAYASAATNACTDAITDNGGVSITTSVSWTKAKSPYCVTASMTVDAGGWLYVEPGVTTLFNSATGLTVQSGGQINLAGTAQELVLFTSSSPTATKGDWAGVTIAATALDAQFDLSNNWTGGSKIQFSTIEFASQALNINNQMIIEYSLIRSNMNNITGTGSGLYYNIPVGKKGVIRYNTFADNEIADQLGAAGYVMGTGELFIDQNFFINNKTAVDLAGTFSQGAGVYVDGSTGLTLNLTGNYFNNQQAKTGGALFFHNTSNALIAKNTFEQILSNDNSGAIYFEYFDGVNAGTVQNNEVMDNTFKNIQGGVFYVYINGPNGSGFNRNNIHNNNVDGVTDTGASFFDMQLAHPTTNVALYADYNLITHNYIQNITNDLPMIQFDMRSPGTSRAKNSRWNNIDYNLVKSSSGVFLNVLVDSSTITSTSLYQLSTLNYNTVNQETTTGTGHFFNVYAKDNADASFGRVYNDINYNRIISSTTTNQQIYVNRINGGGDPDIRLTMQHNNFEIANNVFAQSGTGLSVFTVSSNYWGTDWSASPWNSTPPAFCTDASPALSASPLCAGNAAAVSPVTTAWPSCDVSPADPDCVGAFDLCVNSPAQANCAGVRP